MKEGTVLTDYILSHQLLCEKALRAQSIRLHLGFVLDAGGATYDLKELDSHRSSPTWQGIVLRACQWELIQTDASFPCGSVIAVHPRRIWRLLSDVDSEKNLGGIGTRAHDANRYCRCDWMIIPDQILTAGERRGVG